MQEYLLDKNKDLQLPLTDSMHHAHTDYASMIAFEDTAQLEEELLVDASSTNRDRMPLWESMNYQKELSEAEVPAIQGENMPLSDLMDSWFQGQDSVPLRMMELANKDIRLRSEIQLVPTEPKAMEAIRSKIALSLRRFRRKKPLEDLKALFELEWDLRNFFQQQKYKIKASEALPKIITLTGSDTDVQALTCAEYLSQTWPSTGAKMMELLQSVLDSEDDADSTCESLSSA